MLFPNLDLRRLCVFLLCVCLCNAALLSSEEDQASLLEDERIQWYREQQFPLWPPEVSYSLADSAADSRCMSEPSQGQKNHSAELSPNC